MSLYSHFHLLVPYVALQEKSGIDIQYVTDNGLLTEQGSLDGRKLLFATPCPSERREIGTVIRRFIEEGGTLIATSDDFALDEQMRPTTVRQELLGILQEEPFCTEESMETVSDLKYLPAGTKLTTYWNRIRIRKTAEESQVLARWSDGLPAILSTPRGKGRALYVGTNPCWAALYPEEDEGWARFFESIAEASMA